MNNEKKMFDTANTFILAANHILDGLWQEKDQETTRKIRNQYYEELYESTDESEWRELDSLWDSQWEDHFELIVPTIVNTAFAAELFIKSILTANKIPYSTQGASGHNLESLFSKLEPDMQERIKTETSKNLDSFDSSEDFDSKLKSAATAFNDWRYWFEKENNELSIDFLFNFVYALNLEAEKLFSP